MLVVSGTGVIIGEDPFEGHSWTMGVVLLVPVGVGLLSCVCVCVCCFRSAPANTAAKRYDFEEHANQDHQPPERGDVESMMVF